MLGLNRRTSQRMELATQMLEYSKKLVLALTVAVLLSACSNGDPIGEGDGDRSEPPLAEERYGALSAEFVYPRLGGDRGVQIQAQFLDARGVTTHSALEALEVWKPLRRAQLGECLVTGGQKRADAGDDKISLQLLDVGEIGVHSPRDQMVLQPRRLPDLLSAFYGVVYTSEWAGDDRDDILEYYPGAQYHFHATGTAQAGGFDVVLRAPEPVVLLAANGVEIRDRSVMTASVDEPLDLVWNVDGPARESTQIFIDLSTGFGPDQLRVQCHAEDLGAFSVPAAFLRELSELADGVDLEVRRVHRDQIAVDGLDEVAVYFATTDRVELRLQ